MLINKGEQNTESHVEFVNYTGKWPNLCGGLLTLKIDGTDVLFGYDKKAQHPRFWRSGGRCSMHNIESGEWLIDVSDLPEEFRKYSAEIDSVFNSNVEHGCCGGCR